LTGRTLLVAALLENPYELYDLAPHRPIWTLRSRRRARAGRAVLEYYDGYAPTWRASPDWAAKFGYSESDLARTNEAAVAHLDGLRKRYGITDCVISSAIGPRGDGYVAGTAQTPDEAADYHAVQIAAMGGADMVTAYTLNYTAEAIGILRAARAHGRPVAISFTVRPTGACPAGRHWRRRSRRRTTPPRPTTSSSTAPTRSTSDTR